MKPYTILSGALILLGASCGSNTQPSTQETTKEQMIKADVVKFIKQDVIDYKGTGQVA